MSTWYRVDENFPKQKEFFILKLVAHTMSYANSTINPCIYGVQFKIANTNFAANTVTVTYTKNKRTFPKTINTLEMIETNF